MLSRLLIGQFSESFYPIVDGVGRVAYNYASKLAERGHECYVITPMADTGYRGRFPFEIVDYVSMSVPFSRQFKTGIAVFDKHYNDRVDMLKFDIIHAHTPFTAGAEAWRLAKKHACPLVGTFHSKYYDDFYKATGTELIAQLGVRYVVKFYERCDEVWAVSKNSADTLREYGYRKEIHIMPNGTDLTEPLPEDMKNAREKFGLDTEDPILLYVGQMDYKKNIGNILKASEILSREGLAFRLVLAGQGPDREKIEDDVSKMGISDITCFTGHIYDSCLLNGLYQCADLLVFPSVYDNAPLVVKEAAVMLTPSVVTEGSSTAEVITDKVNGFVAKNTPESLADTIAAALRDKERIIRAGKEARATIPVSWDLVIDQVLVRYQELIKLVAKNNKDGSDQNR